MRVNLWARGVCLMAAMCLAFPSFSYAGGWQEVSGGKKWVKDDGSYIVNQWEWIDDDNDGFAKCYYFDDNGYLVTNTTTPDNCMVNFWGAWCIDYIPQIRRMLPPADSSQGVLMPSEYINFNLTTLQTLVSEGVNVYEEQIGDPELTVDGIIVDGDIYAYYTGKGSWEKSVRYYMNGPRICNYYLPTREEFVENCRRAQIVYSQYLDWEKEQKMWGIQFAGLTYMGDGKGVSLYDYVEDKYYIFDISNYMTDDHWNLGDYVVDNSYSYQLQQ